MSPSCTYTQTSLHCAKENQNIIPSLARNGKKKQIQRTKITIFRILIDTDPHGSVLTKIHTDFNIKP